MYCQYQWKSEETLFWARIIELHILIKHRQLCSKNTWSSFICACDWSRLSTFARVGACACDHTPLLKRPVCADDTTLYSKCDQASDLYQQLELASEIESALCDSVDWSRNWLVDFNAGKTQLVWLTGLVTLVLLMWNWIGLFLRKNHLLRCWSWLSLLNWIRALTLSLFLKLPATTISINLPYNHARSTVAMFGLVLLVTKPYAHTRPINFNIIP